MSDSSPPMMEKWRTALHADLEELRLVLENELADCDCDARLREIEAFEVWLEVARASLAYAESNRPMVREDFTHAHQMIREARKRADRVGQHVQNVQIVQIGQDSDDDSQSGPEEDDGQSGSDED